jgi:hypothetical protein
MEAERSQRKEFTFMDYENILHYFRHHYMILAQNAAKGSLEHHTYDEIVQFMDLCKDVTPLPQRAFETQIALTNLVPNIEPRTRHLVEEAIDQLTYEAQLDPVPY